MIPITWSRPALLGISALGYRPSVRLAVPVHGHEEIRVDLEDVTDRCLVVGGHTAGRPVFEHAVAARREEPAVQ